ncbi:hypothetical protein SLA2020_245890 [Shorea laevis]
MRTVFSKSPLPARTTPPPSPPRQTFSESLMDEDIEVAESIITKWDSSNSSSFRNIDYLFSQENRHEVKQYLNSIKQLQRAMQYFVSENPVAEKLVRAQNLMQTAMKRLQKEFLPDPQVEQGSTSSGVCLQPFLQSFSLEIEHLGFRRRV